MSFIAKSERTDMVATNSEANTESVQSAQSVSQPNKKGSNNV